MGIYDIDYRKKENQTFKNWFKLMFIGGYIPLFLIGLAFAIGFLCTTLNESSEYIYVIIPLSVSIVTAYKGFYQYWQKLKQGK